MTNPSRRGFAWEQTWVWGWKCGRGTWPLKRTRRQTSVLSCFMTCFLGCSLRTSKAAWDISMWSMQRSVCSLRFWRHLLDPCVLSLFWVTWAWRWRFPRSTPLPPVTHPFTSGPPGQQGFTPSPWCLKHNRHLTNFCPIYSVNINGVFIVCRALESGSMEDSGPCSRGI